MSASTATKPSRRPRFPNFSCGPCTKFPGWTVDVLKSAPLGRSHRAPLGKSRLQRVIGETHALLGLPGDYLVGILPASDTGAVEAALWSLLGPRPVDVFAWESFGKEWVTDCLQQLAPCRRAPSSPTSARCRTCGRPISGTTSSSPGTAPPPA
jgi:phosphoserine aminotransferase